MTEQNQFQYNSPQPNIKDYYANILLSQKKVKPIKETNEVDNDDSISDGEDI